MRKETFFTTESLDWTTAEEMKQALSATIDQLAQDARDAGYEPLWQTFMLSSEETVDEDMSFAGINKLKRWVILSAEVDGVKE